jgi:rubredoxin
MSGCEKPVIICSGSGNQGITVSVPVLEYAKELGASWEKTLRALTISNLVAIHQKSGIGSLSAYCGAVSAGAAAGAGIAYLLGGGLREIEHTLVNCLAITSGVVCDGAKASCAGKIAIALDAAMLGYRMIENEQQFRGGDGIVKKGVEETIGMVGRLSLKVVEKLEIGNFILYVAQIAENEVFSSGGVLTLNASTDRGKATPASATVYRTVEINGYRCDICGYVYEGENPPAEGYRCPICKADHTHFHLIEK